MFDHVTVLKEEAVEGLAVKSDGIYVDCTLGGAGHSTMIASQLNESGLLIGLDQDDQALAYARSQLEGVAPQVMLKNSNFAYIDEVLDECQINKVDGFLFDLGVSSPQLDEAERGFSYQHDAPLDMRMDRSQSLSAYHVVNEWSKKALADTIYHYGEERFARRIASNIVESRQQRPLASTFDLVDVIKTAIPAHARRTGPHPAKRTFQAIRIAVNDELQVFERALQQTVSRLNSGGRVAVITFHSLEDRICKQFFKKQSQGCTCPPDFPQCVCDNHPELKVITKKPIHPNEDEIENNPRARSAKLRIAQKN